MRSTESTEQTEQQKQLGCHDLSGPARAALTYKFAVQSARVQHEWGWVRFCIETTVSKLPWFEFRTVQTSSKFDEFSVFSEIYYKNGWNAYIDGELQPYTNVNYILRGMEIPKGEHIIKFKFEPSVIKTGSTISLISYALMLLIPLSCFFYFKKS